MHSDIENGQLVGTGRSTIQDSIVVDDEKNDTPLHLACRDGNADTVRALLQQDCNARVDGKNKDGETPLHLACRDGNADTVRALLQQNCNARVDGKNKDGETPLHLACRRGDVDLVKFLLQHDSAKVDCKSRNGDTPLHIACRRGDVDLVKLLLQHDSAKVDCKSRNGDTPLCIACSTNKADLVKVLLQHQSSAHISCAMPLKIACRLRNIDMIHAILRLDHSMTRCDGDTPLHVACRNGAADAVEVLWQCDPSANTYALNNSRKPLSSQASSIDIMDILCNMEISLHAACRYGNVSVLTALLKRNSSKIFDEDSINGDTPLHVACRHNEETDLVNVLLQYMPSVKLSDKNWYGNTPLHLACKNGKTGIVKLLLKYDSGPTANITNNAGITPFDLACSHGTADMVKALLHHSPCALKGANINQKNIYGDTSLHLACRKGDFDIVKALLQYCDDIKIDNKDGNGDTPLHLACRKGDFDVVKALLQYCDSIKIDDKDGNGDTPLHLACRKGDFDIVKALLQYCDSIKIDDKNWYGDTPLHLACCHNKVDIVETLLMHDPSAVVDIENSVGDTLLHIACSCGVADTVKALLQHCSALQLDVVNSKGDTPLHLASCLNRVDILEILLMHDPTKVDFKNDAGDTLLHVACSHSATDTAKILQRYNAQPDIKNLNGDTPLHLASCYNRVDIMEVLLLHDPTKVDIKNDAGDTLLHVACRHSATDTVKALLQHWHCSAQLDVRNQDSMTPLHLACRNGEVDVVKVLLQYDSSSWSCPIFTALDIACEFNRIGTIRALIEHYSKPLCGGDTLLHVACRNNSARVVKVIFQYNFAGAEVDALNNNGETPSTIACKLGSIDIINTILLHDPSVTREDGDSPLHIACREGKTDMIKAILKHDPDARVNYENEKGDTPIHITCRNGKAGEVKANIVQILLQHDPSAEVDCENREGDTPIDIACREGIVDIVRILLQHDPSAKVDCKNKGGDTPIHIACREGTADIVRILLQHAPSAKVDCENREGDTPIHIACREGTADIVRILLQHDPSAKVDCKNIGGDTPIHIACRKGIADIVRILLQHHPSAKVDCENRGGDTPIHIACRKGIANIVRILLRHDPSAKVDCKNTEGDAPIHIACRNGEAGIVETLLQHGVTDISNVIEMAVQFNRYDVVKSLAADCDISEFQRCSLLHIAAAQSDRRIIQLLVSECGIPVSLVDDQGNTPLHVATMKNNYDAIAALLELKSSINVRNKEGKTPVDLISRLNIEPLYDSHISRYSREIESEYTSMAKLATKRYAKAHCITRLFVVGYPGAGKSSLVETLKREGFFQSTFTRVSDKFVPLHTAGIVPTVYTSDIYGRVQFYDFAGDPEYYSSHAAILERLFLSDVGSNVFFVVLNLNQSESEIEKKYTYWCNFISHNTRNLQCRPSVLAIGSHVDQLSSSDMKKRKKLHLENLPLISRCFLLDCCNPGSSGIKKLRQALQDIARNSQPYELSYEASLLLGLLEKDFSNVTACTTKTLLSHVQNLSLLRLPRSLSGLYPPLQQLQAIGTLLILGGKEDDSYLVLNVAELTNEVHKKLFSDDADSSLATFKIGLLPPSLLQDEILPKYITKDCLIQLQYCQEISFIDIALDQDSESSLQVTSQEDSILFFPALCKVDKKDVSWQCGESDFSISWVARCTDSQDYFPSRFLHVLLLRIVFSSSLCVPQHDSSSDQHGHLKRRCKMWKTGVHWQTEEGVECEVHVDIIKEVVVSVRCERSNLKRCFALFNGVIGYVMEAQREFCNSNELSFHLLDSQSNLYLLDNVKACLNERKHSAVDVTGERRMPLSDLQHIGTTFWNTLFSMDVDSVIKHLQPLVTQWFQLGTHLKFPHSTLTAIEVDHHSSVMKQKVVMVEQWIDPLHSPSTDPPCWWSLVNALEEIDENTCVQTIKQEHGEAVSIQKRLLDSEYHYMQPDDEFLDSLSGVLESKWPHLAVLLGLSGADIQAVRKEGKGKSWKEQALLMLGKWVEKGGATYGQLFEKLKPISLFELCQ